MSSFFNELMESVQQMNEILRSERRSSVQTENAEPETINSAGPSSQVRRPIRSIKAQTDLPPMNLAPNLPDDHVMQQLMQLLHEELGFPERKTISLTTSINFDLGCNGDDAQHLIETLEDHFGIDFVDFDSYRYFQPDGNGVYLKRKAKGRGDKVPLTIGMLYRAIKTQRWDTDELEGL